MVRDVPAVAHRSSGWRSPCVSVAPFVPYLVNVAIPGAAARRGAPRGVPARRCCWRRSPAGARRPRAPARGRRRDLADERANFVARRRHPRRPHLRRRADRRRRVRPHVHRARPGGARRRRRCPTDPEAALEVFRSRIHPDDRPLFAVAYSSEQLRQHVGGADRGRVPGRGLRRRHALDPLALPRARAARRRASCWTASPSTSRPRCALRDEARRSRRRSTRAPGGRGAGGGGAGERAALPRDDRAPAERRHLPARRRAAPQRRRPPASPASTPRARSRSTPGSRRSTAPRRAEMRATYDADRAAGFPEPREAPMRRADGVERAGRVRGLRAGTRARSGSCTTSPTASRPSGRARRPSASCGASRPRTPLTGLANRRYGDRAHRRAALDARRAGAAW